MRRIAEVKLWEIGVGVVIGASILGVLSNWHSGIDALYYDVQEVRYELNKNESQPDRRRILRQVIDGAPISKFVEPLILSPAKLRESPRAAEYEFYSQLWQLAQLDADAKRGAAVYVPTNNWRYEQYPLIMQSEGLKGGTCMIKPFLVPAISGVALLDGLPSPRCKPEFYGYEYYMARGEWGSRYSKGNWDDASLCAHAVGEGLGNVFELRDESYDHGLTIKEHECL